MKMLITFWMTVVSAWSAETQAAQSIPESAGLCIVGYLPQYRLESVTVESLRGVTDLVYFGIEASEDGSLPDPVVPVNDLKALKDISKALSCRLLLTVGGWGRSDGFPEMARKAASRKRFVAGLTAFCRESGFAGIDYDWEHPKNAEALGHYAALIRDTHEAFAEHGLIVTVAQASWQDLGKQVYDAVARVHLMSYDHDFPQATLEKTTRDVEKLKHWGCPPDKIAVGLPFYGRNEKREARTYADLIRGVPAEDVRRDLVDGYAFNGKQTIVDKVILAIDEGLAGVMIWELGQDSREEGKSLLGGIREWTESIAQSSELFGRVKRKWYANGARDPWLNDWMEKGREPQEIVRALKKVWWEKHPHHGKLPEADWPTGLKEFGVRQILFKGAMGIVRMSLDDGLEKGYVFETPLASEQPILDGATVWQEVWGGLWRFERRLEAGEVGEWDGDADAQAK